MTFFLIDHSIIAYPEVEKCFYQQHEDIKALSEEEVHTLRREMGRACFQWDCVD